MDTADIIASVMLVLGPVLLAIGVFVFIYKNKDQWDAEIAELRKKRQERQERKVKKDG